MTIWQLLKAPGVAVVIYIYGHVMVQALAYTAGKFALTILELVLDANHVPHSQPGLLLHSSEARRLRLQPTVHLYLHYYCWR